MPVNAERACALLPIIRDMDFALVARSLAKVADGCYILEWPDEVTLAWVMQHTYPVYLDDKVSLLVMRWSIEERWFKHRLNELPSYAPLIWRLCGYEVMVPVRKVLDDSYQDGSVIKEPTVKLYYNTWCASLQGVLREGLIASWPSHGAEGLWAYFVPSVSSYEWGSTEISTAHSVLVEFLAPSTTYDALNATYGHTGALFQSEEILMLKSYGTCNSHNFQCVVQGRHKSSSLPVMVTSVRTLIPPRNVFALRQHFLGLLPDAAMELIDLFLLKPMYVQGNFIYPWQLHSVLKDQ